MAYVISGTCLLALIAFGMGRVRSVQLRRMAHTLGLRYDRVLSTLLTEDAAARFYFLRQGQHTFLHVLTYRESAAFMRVGTDRMLLPGKPPVTYTLVTAELTRGAFTPLILTPRLPGKQTHPHPALPPQLAQRYELSAPDGFVLPAAVTGFLQTAIPCYLELTQTALIYHEFDQKSVSQIQPLRYRALQLLKALVHQPPLPATAVLQERTPTNLDASLLLKLKTGAATYTQAAVKPAGSGRWVYGVLFITVLLALCIFTGYALKYWLPH